jgi:hypothetical protein
VISLQQPATSGTNSDFANLVTDEVNGKSVELHNLLITGKTTSAIMNNFELKRGHFFDYKITKLQCL